MQLGQKQYDGSSLVTDALGPIRATLQDIVVHVTPHDPDVGGTNGSYTLQMSVDGLTFVDLGTVGEGRHFFHVNSPFVRVVPSTVPTGARSVRVSIFEAGAPITATLASILAFRGDPKTPGFPHYLDGLPMSVVSQLGYVDRGIGKRGTFSLVDDFVLPWGAISGAFDGAWGPYRALTVGAESALGAEGYIAGSARLAAGRADAHDRALLYQLPGPFNYVPGRRLWFSTRPSLRKPADSTFPTTGSALIGIVQFVDTSGFLDGWAGDVTHGTSGIFFLKKQNETDWSFYVAQYSGDTPSIVAIPNVVTAALGHSPAAGQYVPLGFQIDATGRCIAYVDGNVVGTVAADNAIWAPLAPAAFNHDDLYGDFALIAAVESGAALDGLILNVDHVLVAEETQADAD